MANQLLENLYKLATDKLIWHNVLFNSFKLPDLLVISAKYEFARFN